MNIEHLHDLVEGNNGRISFRGNCHDCKSGCIISAVALEDGIHVDGGAVYDPWLDKRYLVKCDTCYKKDPVLRAYQDCEVYARVVGYLRPVKQFNVAKQAEFKDRVNFKLKRIKGNHESYSIKKSAPA